MRKCGSYYVGKNGNKYSISQYTEEQAENLSKTLINCKNCIDCISCKDCKNLTEGSSDEKLTFGMRFELINQGKYGDRRFYNGDFVFYDYHNRIIKQGEPITVRINDNTIMQNVLLYGLTDDNDYGVFEFRIPNSDNGTRILIDHEDKVEIID